MPCNVLHSPRPFSLVLHQPCPSLTPSFSLSLSFHYPGVFDRNSISTNLALLSLPLTLSLSYPLFLSLLFLSLSFSPSFSLFFFFYFSFPLTRSYILILQPRSPLRGSGKASLGCIPRDKLRGSIIHGNLLQRLYVAQSLYVPRIRVCTNTKTYKKK